ncbi:putative glycoside hydrolase [Metabacillus sp. RGM 3146]|uniref:putative glycoside hydrolase n=1 Tax=Metabacillus sp. RGM 3146 TaxID=3401092 RepID=UPI003B9D7119
MLLIGGLAGLALVSPAISQAASASGDVITNDVSFFNKKLPENMPRFNDTSLNIPYPDAVRGIYVTGNSAGGARFPKLIKLLDDTELNTMVIDVKDDRGNLTFHPDKKSPFYDISKNYIKDPKAMLKVLEKHQIYPIARIVVFKDSVLAQKKPEWSFLDGNKPWKNGKGDSFVSPFEKEVWKYNTDIAIQAAKLGFKEIQFDYVRFPEGFEHMDKKLKYNLGDYKNVKQDNVQKRVTAVTDFVKYAHTNLKPYGVKVSADIFGYAATLPEAPGIGQNFTKIADQVDIMSAMIYPSHWTPYFGIQKPDKEPYKLVSAYAKLEKKKLAALKTRPISRPWIQDFTASYLGTGNYIQYGKSEVEAQIKALNEQGINEFLLWDASNSYTPGVDYTPLKK